MNEAQLEERLAALEAKADAIFRSAEKTRKYFLATLIITVVLFVLPLLGMVVLVPYYLSTLDLGSLII